MQSCQIVSKNVGWRQNQWRMKTELASNAGILALQAAILEIKGTKCGRCSRLKMGTSRTLSGGLRKGQSRCELLGGLSGFFSRRCRGLRSCVEWVLELEDSSPVLTWILVYSGESPGESVLVPSGGMHVCIPPEL